jgi:hypothetical protein
MDFFKHAMKLAHEPVAAKAVKQRLEARHVRALASKCDPVRHDFELGLADRMDAEARSILIPPKPLQMGLGGEIVPSAEDGLPGIESVLQEPDLLNAEASKQRAYLLERTGSLEIGVEVAEQAGASNAIEKMLCHQMAAAHRRAMSLIAESEQAKDPQASCLKAKTAVRLLDGFARAALVLQRLQMGESRSVQVQNVCVAGTAVVGQISRR